ncbi:hypothetical protein HHK36_030036 [Tetracentron sinense]|uniref:Thioester reductase (TE) domain-containing protein n=1 Tax=Tetracentron sinense TaxID=13715 RepID=A0A835D055_TETSI|nr:hypothetical protein HHK36_030036 [Tetracentron sinense]
MQETLIDPCIKGTVNVLSSCSKTSSVKRVVLTSSCSSIRYRDDAQLVSPLNESHWSDTQYCKHYNLWYAYAKTLAEKEAWRLANASGINLVVVNPSFVVRPLLAPQPTSTLLLILAIIKVNYDGIVGVATKEEMTSHIAWTPARLLNWGSPPSKHSLECLTTASIASKKRDFYEVCHISKLQLVGIVLAAV